MFCLRYHRNQLVAAIVIVELSTRVFVTMAVPVVAE